MPTIYKPYSDPMQDRRRKIHPDQYQEIRNEYKASKSTRKLAKQFNCSRRLIVFILHPERLKERQRQDKESQHWKTYYNRENLTQAVRDLRRYKTSLGLAINSTTGKPTIPKSTTPAHKQNSTFGKWQWQNKQS